MTIWARILLPVAGVCALATIACAATGVWWAAAWLACSTAIAVVAMRAVW